MCWASEGTSLGVAGAPRYPRSVTTPHPSTKDVSYTRRLQRLSGSSWKARLGAQAPYRWNLRRLQPGRVLDIGCGLGRNLSHLGGNGVGVDHNEASVNAARDDGWTAYTPDEFQASAYARPFAFDSMLLAHVLEHLPADDADALIASYLPYVRPGGQIIFITPQERGYATDETHVRFVDAAVAAAHLRRVGASVSRDYSFPFPRPAGRFFPYNEFVVVGRLPG